MDFGGRLLRYTQHQEQYSQYHLYVGFGPFHARHHARWLVSPALSRYWFVCSGTPTLETGEVVPVRLWPCISPSANVIHLKGVIWLLLATSVELPLMVRPNWFPCSIFPL